MGMVYNPITNKFDMQMITEAPDDSGQYVRQNGEWVKVDIKVQAEEGLVFEE
jgi:hypothetical protein